MECERVVFSGHAIQRMFERGIGRDAALAVVAHGETIAAYADDKPCPSKLLLGFVAARPLHVVVALNERMGACVVVTAYEPALEQWGADFRTRKTQ
jgi:Domain of unknown function (DUF4258)